jgi:hypothetical protein
MPEERLPPTISHRRKLCRTHIDLLIEWRRTFRTTASGRGRTPTGVATSHRSIDRTRPMTRNGPTSEHCGNHDDNYADDERPSNEDDKEMVGGRWYVE